MRIARWLVGPGVLILALILLGIFYLRGHCNQELQVKIPENLHTADELLTFAKPYLDDYVGQGNAYSVGQISMSLDKLQEGEIRIQLIKHVGSKKPYVFELQMDTSQHILKQINCVGDDGKAYPGETDFSAWRVNSAEAVAKAKTLLPSVGEDAGVLLTGYHDYEYKQDVWRISYLGRYWVVFDANSGAVNQKLSNLQGTPIVPISHQ